MMEEGLRSCRWESLPAPAPQPCVPFRKQLDCVCPWCLGAEPFVWIATRSSILGKLERLCQPISGTGHLSGDLGLLGHHLLDIAALPAADKGIDDLRVELGAGILEQGLEGGTGRQRRTVRAVGRHGA